MQLALIPTIFFCSILAGHTSSQHSLVMVGSLCIIIGFLGLLLVHSFKSTILWIILLGIGGGFTFSLSMMFFNLRTNNANEAARLSGMAQSIGYLLAAFGPMFLVTYMMLLITGQCLLSLLLEFQVYACSPD